MQLVRSEVVAELLGEQRGRSCGDGQEDSLADRPAVLRILAWRPEPSNEPLSERLAPVKSDADDDLDVPRRRKRPRRQQSNDGNHGDGERDALCVLETMNQGDVDATGTQIWRASIVLAEYILANESDFRGSVVLELGCGVGLVAIAAARVAKLVVATDGDESALTVCDRNVRRNCQEPDRIRIRYLDWEDETLTDDSTVAARFKWTHEDETTSRSGFDWIVASDVFYDDEVADLFLDKLHRLLLQHPNVHTIIAMEKRVVFSAVTLSEISLGYDAFRARVCLHDSTSHTKQAANAVYCSQCALDSQDPATRFVATQLPVHLLPRIYQYDRVSTLEIWELCAVQRTNSSS